MKAEPRADGLSPLPGLPISVSMSLLKTQRGEREKDCETQKGNPSLSQPQPAPSEPPKAEGCFPGLLVSPAEFQRLFHPFITPLPCQGLQFTSLRGGYGYGPHAEGQLIFFSLIVVILWEKTAKFVGFEKNRLLISWFVGWLVGFSGRVS